LKAGLSACAPFRPYRISCARPWVHTMFVVFKKLVGEWAFRPANGRGLSACARTAPLNWASVWVCVVAVLVAMEPHNRPSTAQQSASAARSQSVETADGTKSGSWEPTQDSWNDQLSNPSFWANRKSGSKSSGSANWAPPSGLTKYDQRFIPPLPNTVSLPGTTSGSQQKRPAKSASNDGDDDESSNSKGGNTYRTMCVRLCDGFYFPVSFATTRDNFERDAATCERNCGGATDAKLYTYRNPGGDVEEMEDLDGKPYKKLQTAFLFRTKYEASCKCRAHPWEDASQTRHKTYALSAAAQKGDHVAARELNALKVKAQEEARAAALDKLAAAKLRREAALQEKAAADAAFAAAKAARRLERSAKLGLNGSPAGALADGTDVVFRRAPEMSAQPKTGEVGPRLSLDVRSGDSRAGRFQDPAAAPAGGRTSVIILRYGARTPTEISVPSARPALTPAPWRRDADAGRFPIAP
jgi:Protein of unknown function (DUF2865)